LQIFRTAICTSFVTPEQRTIRCADAIVLHEILVGAPRAIQSCTSAGWNRQLRTPNRWRFSWPHVYARRTLSSWHPTNSATSNAVIRRFDNTPSASAFR
jgi:hypothetical protein